MDAESLVKLLGPSRVVKHEKGPGYLLLKPPANSVEVKVYRERFTRLSTELAWVFVAAAETDADKEAIAIGKKQGVLKKVWRWETKGRDAERLQALLSSIFSGEPFATLLRKAKPELIAIRLERGVVLVKVAKTIVGPYAGSLREAYDLSWKLALYLAKS